MNSSTNKVESRRNLASWLPGSPNAADVTTVDLVRTHKNLERSEIGPTGRKGRGVKGKRFFAADGR